MGFEERLVQPLGINRSSGRIKGKGIVRRRWLLILKQIKKRKQKKGKRDGGDFRLERGNGLSSHTRTQRGEGTYHNQSGVNLNINSTRTRCRKDSESLLRRGLHRLHQREKKTVNDKKINGKRIWKERGKGNLASQA